MNATDCAHNLGGPVATVVAGFSIAVLAAIFVLTKLVLWFARCCCPASENADADNAHDLQQRRYRGRKTPHEVHLGVLAVFSGLSSIVLTKVSAPATCKHQQTALRPSLLTNAADSCHPSSS
jgi:hypothetical protein